MPELPEVETVRRVLEKDLIGRKINNIEIRYKNIIENDVDYFLNNMLNKKIKAMKRYAKFLIFELEGNNELGYLISHLRMEGKYFYLPHNSIDNKHIHVIFNLDNGYDLIYQDVRKFGRMEYKKENELFTTKPLNEVGYDLVLTDFDQEKIEEIAKKIKKKNLPIKTILLDQKIVAGLGNIYVDEVLFNSKINPHRLGKELQNDDISKIITESKKILLKAIEYKGTTIRSYTSSLGVEGEFQQFLNVHTKTICPICNSKLIKDKTNGRGTYYCERCQK